jgi:hypothetical protein
MSINQATGLLLTKKQPTYCSRNNFCEDNMSNIPFEKQYLQVNLVEQLEREVALGHGVSGEILLAAIEQAVGRKLPAPLPEFNSPFHFRGSKRVEKASAGTVSR